MTKDEARAALESANGAIALAIQLVRGELPTLQRLVEESRRFEGIGPIVDPTLWRDSERQIVARSLVPIYIAAIALERIYTERVEALTAAAAAVGITLGPSAIARGDEGELR